MVSITSQVYIFFVVYSVYFDFPILSPPSHLPPIKETLTFLPPLHKSLQQRCADRSQGYQRQSPRRTGVGAPWWEGQGSMRCLRLGG